MPSTPAESPRSTRDRPAKAPLSREAVVDAGLALLRSEGLESVTMRRVATALDTGPASLYVYVGGRASLLQAMLDRVVATVTLERPDPARWREQLHGLLDRLHAALGAHSGIAATTLADPPPSEAVLLLSDNLLALLLAAGLEPQEAAWASDAATLLVTASAIEHDETRLRDRRDGADRRAQVDALRTTMAALAPERFPALTAHATAMVSGDHEERFHFAVDLLLDGVVARASR